MAEFGYRVRERSPAEPLRHVLGAIFSADFTARAVASQGIMDLFAYPSRPERVLEVVSKRMVHLGPVGDPRFPDVAAEPFRPCFDASGVWSNQREQPRIIAVRLLNST